MSKFNKGFAAAYKVAQLIEAGLPESMPQYGSDYCLIEAYQNGREQGVTIWIFAGNVAFYICKYRKSDDIGFYKGKYSMQSISQEAYENGFTSFGEVSESAIQNCAEEIINQIKKLFKI